MPLALPNAAVKKYSQITDLKQYILEVFNQVLPENIDIALNRVLCAAYIGSEKTRGGIIKPQDTVAEDIWQGKAALVIKPGPSAFADSPEVTFNGFVVNPGDWVTFKVGNSSQIEINGYPCRIVADHFIESKIPDPRMVTS
jgi:co-chaperonin GroES (HSP10)